MSTPARIPSDVRFFQFVVFGTVLSVWVVLAWWATMRFGPMIPFWRFGLPRPAIFNRPYQEAQRRPTYTPPAYSPPAQYSSPAYNPPAPAPQPTVRATPKPSRPTPGSAETSTSTAGWSMGGRLLESGTPDQQATLAQLVGLLEQPRDDSGAPVSRASLVTLLNDARANDFLADAGLREKLVRSERSRAKREEAKSEVTPVRMKKKKKKQADDPNLKPANVALGAAFLQAHSGELASARQRWSTDPGDIAGVLMWASGIGKDTGSYRAVSLYLTKLLFIDSAAQVAFEQEGVIGDLNDSKEVTHRNWVKQNMLTNLVALLRYCALHGTDPLEIRSSWSGTIGIPQFAPTSFKYAVDGDSDGRVDLFQMPDAIASVANFLDQNGYRDHREKALRAYDNSGAFVKSVGNYAKAVEAWPNR